ncbi:nuclear transport factor 2 family protein [Flavobacterium sp. H122]|uniref:nuclear transport factor 2 family protein n=1 Tax=Flavobacterium sp. H122 TaxID=2529860 RepID=UPI0010AB361E|nr:nuclear transport factor 2 family protein [Flavobacterium sp. H122]
MKLSFIIYLFASFQMLAQNEDLKLKEEIKRLDYAHARAIFEGNAVALDSLMNDDVTVNHPTNRIVKEKKELLALIRKGVIKYTTFERTPEKFLFYKDMVVIMGSEIVTPAKGAPNAGKKLQRRYTNIWMKNNNNNKWQLYIRHANNICPNK